MCLPSWKIVAQNEQVSREGGKFITPGLAVLKEAATDTAGRTSGGLCHSPHSPSSPCACSRGWWRQQKMQT